jgi:hypothetical protein
MKLKLLTSLLILLALAASGVHLHRLLSWGTQNERQLQRIRATQKTAERRIALVIGNAAYRNVNRLANPANDAEDIAAALRDLGFELVGGGAQQSRPSVFILRQT